MSKFVGSMVVIGLAFMAFIATVLYLEYGNKGNNRRKSIFWFGLSNKTSLRATSPSNDILNNTVETTTTFLSKTSKARTKLSSNEYISYGLNHSSLISLTGEDTFQSSSYPINPRFSAYNTSFDSFIINVDGYVQLSNSNKHSLNLFPFDGNIDMRRNGEIRHGQIKEPGVLESIGADIRERCKMERFTPIWAYTITWFEARPHWKYNGDEFYGAKSNYKNTFQLFMATNGSDSFAIYNYIQMEWPNNHIPIEFMAGYLLNFGSKGWPKPIRDDLEKKLVDNLVKKSNMGRPGRWLITFKNSNCRF